MPKSRFIDAGRPKAVIARASDLLNEGDRKSAEKMLREHLNLKPDDVVALRLLASPSLAHTGTFLPILIVRMAS